MMQLSFRHALRVIVGLILCLNGFLTSEAVETPTADSTSAEYNERYIQHLKKREQRWMKLIPNLSSIQYAGSTGSVALGIGWDYGCGNRWETHVMLGVIPKQHYWHTYWSLTLKEVYTPWTLPVKRHFAVKPLYATLFVNSILHSDFWTSEPDRYPDGYYGFSSRIRFHLTRVRDKNFMIFNQAKDIEYWAAFQGRLIYLYSLVLLIPEDKLPA